MGVYPDIGYYFECIGIKGIKTTKDTRGRKGTNGCKRTADSKGPKKTQELKGLRALK